MVIKIISTTHFDADEFDGKYFGEMQIALINEYMVGNQLETQLIELDLTIRSNGIVDTNGAQMESRWKGKCDINDTDGHFYSAELTAEQFDYYTSLDVVQAEINRFKHMDLAA